MSNEIRIDNKYVKGIIKGENKDIFKIAVAITKAIEEIELEKKQDENEKENISKEEKQKAFEELNQLIQKKQQKEGLNKKSIEKRIKDIKRKWPIKGN